MSHLIQPLDIESTLYCVNQHGGRATKGVNTSSIGTPTDPVDVSSEGGPWVAELLGVVSDFELSFGVGCGSSVALDISLSSPYSSYTHTMAVYINGVFSSGPHIFDQSTPSGTVNISLSDLACGNIITLLFSLENDEGELASTLQIASIT